MPQLAVPQLKKFVYLKVVVPDMSCHLITFLVAEADRAAAGRAAAEKFVYLKSVLPDMRCQLSTFLGEEADRANWSKRCQKCETEIIIKFSQVILHCKSIYFHSSSWHWASGRNLIEFFIRPR